MHCPRATDCDGFRNKYTSAFDSVLTRGLDWRAYCEAKKAGTDKGGYCQGPGSLGPIVFRLIAQCEKGP